MLPCKKPVDFHFFPQVNAEHVLFVYLPPLSLALATDSISMIFFLVSLYFRYDYLRITNDSNNIIGVFCGLQIGNWVRVTGNFAEITFHSDRIIQRTGYELFFSYTGYPGK